LGTPDIAGAEFLYDNTKPLCLMQQPVILLNLCHSICHMILS